MTKSHSNNQIKSNSNNQIKSNPKIKSNLNNQIKSKLMTIYNRFHILLLLYVDDIVLTSDDILVLSHY